MTSIKLPNGGSGLISPPTVTISAPGGSNAPASYPSIISGWHYGKWSGSYTKANAKAVNRLKKAAPELLANDGKPATPPATSAQALQAQPQADGAQRPAGKPRLTHLTESGCFRRVRRTCQHANLFRTQV